MCEFSDHWPKHQFLTYFYVLRSPEHLKITDFRYPLKLFETPRTVTDRQLTVNFAIKLCSSNCNFIGTLRVHRYSKSRCRANR